MKKLVNDWIMLAEKDVKTASIIINEEYLTNIVAFHCQQAIEKYFKAYILEHDKPLLKIHDLPKLYGMKRTRSLFRLGLVFLVLSYMTVAAGCGNIEETSEVPTELAGTWYDKNYELAFEITQEGEGYIAAKKLHCTLTFSGNFVYFRYDGKVMGSFYYSINKNGELTMTLGTEDFKDIESASPFIKSDATLQGVPVELIGKWYAIANPPSTPNFEITSVGTITISGTATAYKVHVSGNSVFVLEGSVLKGTFRYVIRYGEMTVMNGTDLCEGLSVLSPFAKKNR